MKPLGFQNPKPRFTWTMVGEVGLQSAYRILVSDCRETLENGVGNLWDSGEVPGAKSIAIEYGGIPLKSRTRYYWRVTVVDSYSRSVFTSDITWFETGIFLTEEWKGGWIQSPAPRQGVCPLFIKHFTLKEDAEEARIYISGIGYCELFVNGLKVGDSQLDPGWTDYTKRVLYRTFDVANLLKKGENSIGIQLGEGWYGMDHEGAFKLIGKNPDWYGIPKVICNLYGRTIGGIHFEVYTEGGAQGGWYCSKGPIRKNNIYDGEFYDARLDKDGWNQWNYKMDDNWKPALESYASAPLLDAQIMPPIREIKAIRPVHVAYAGEEHSVVFDLGVNIAGWARIEIRGKAGQKVTMRYGELLNPDGTLNQKNLRSAKATDVYIMKGAGTETYQPRFTYHGFRYIQVDTDPGVLIDRLTGYCVGSAVERVGTFMCESDLLNKIYNAVVQTEQNNLHSVPTDCPQRDERLAWLNDMTVRCEEGLYNFDMILLYEKWLNDISDAQDEATGSIPDTAPYYFGCRPACHISSVYILIPWFIYKFYGDTYAMKKHYSGMKRYLEFKVSQTQNGLIKDEYIGEWASPMTECVLGYGENAVPNNVPQQLMTTGYLYYDCIVMENISKILGLQNDGKWYHDIAEQTAKAINECFFDTDMGHYRPDTQGTNLFPLFLGIVPEQARQSVLQHLIYDLVEEHNYHITTGNQMTRYLYEVLCREGENNLAYRLATSKTYPGIGYMLECGATTIWERWENMAGNNMNSHDHPMLGAFTVWFQKGIVGLDSEQGLAGDKITIKPSLIEGLQYAAGSYKSPKGLVKSGWKISAKSVEFEIAVPWNTKAEVLLPDVCKEKSKLHVTGENWESFLTDGNRMGMILKLGPGQYKILYEID
jgi:Alpha-L-rhamnosidase N-terminal domain./Bacterial alpha-L-rhamnosidase.